MLAEGLQFELVHFAGGEGDYVFGGLGELEVDSLCEIHEVLLVLVSGKFLEEFGRAVLVREGLLGLGRERVVNHLTIIL